MQIYVNTAKLSSESARAAAFDHLIKYDQTPAKTIFALFADQTSRDVAEWYLARLAKVEKLEIETSDQTTTEIANVVDMFAYLARDSLRSVKVAHKFHGKPIASPFIVGETLRINGVSWLLKLYDLWKEDNEFHTAEFPQLTEICNYSPREWRAKGFFAKACLELGAAPQLSEIVLPMSFWKNVKCPKVRGQTRIGYAAEAPPLWNIRDAGLTHLYIGKAVDSRNLTAVINMCKACATKLYVDCVEFDQIRSSTGLAAAQCLASLNREDVGTVTGAECPKIWDSQKDEVQTWVVRLQLNVTDVNSS